MVQIGIKDEQIISFLFQGKQNKKNSLSHQTYFFSQIFTLIFNVYKTESINNNTKPRNQTLN
jgi:hypothetical protein